MTPDSQWKKYVYFCVFTLAIFTLATIKQPSVIISPILKVGVVQREQFFHSGSNVIKKCNASESGITQATTPSENDRSSHVEKCMVSNTGLKRCELQNTTDDWTFNCTVKCANVSETLTKLNNATINIEELCSSMELENVSKTFKSVHSNTPLYSIPYGTDCMYNLIESMCDFSLPVPNIVHYVWFSRKRMNFYHFLSFVSVLKYQKPCLILVHSDIIPYGIYWNYLLRLANNIVHVIMTPPTKIHGKEIGRVEHQADVARLMVLQDFGGIYVDTDEIVLKTLDPLRIHNFTLSHALSDNLSNGLILSAPNAEFISHWLDGYRTYRKSQWAYHSTILPFKLSKIYPSLLHIEDKTFVRPNYTQLKLLFRSNFNWSENYGIHLYIRFYKFEHNFVDIRRLNTTMGSVARYVIYDTKELCENGRE